MDTLLSKHTYLGLVSACLVLASLEVTSFFNAADNFFPLLFCMCYLAAGFAYFSSKSNAHWPLSIALIIKFFDLSMNVTLVYDKQIDVFITLVIAVVHTCIFIYRSLLSSGLLLIAGLAAMLFWLQLIGSVETLAIVLISILTGFLRVLNDQQLSNKRLLNALQGVEERSQQQFKLMAEATNVQLIDMYFSQAKVEFSAGIGFFTGEHVNDPASCLTWWRSVLSSDYSRQFEEAMQTSCLNGEPVSLTLAINLAGDLQYYRVSVLATRHNSTQEYHRIIIILHDQQAEIAQKQRYQRNEAIIKVIRDVCDMSFVWGLIDREKGTWVSLQGQCYALFEQKVDAWLGRKALIDGGWEDMPDNDVSKLQFALASGQPLIYERRYLTPESDQLRTIACCLWVNIDDDSVMECVLLDNSSISSRDKQIKELSESLKIAESATADFLTSVNHELMTPMNSLASYIQVAFANSVNQVVRGHLSSAMYSVRRLQIMLNDTVSMGELHLVHMRPNNKPFSLGQMIHSLKEGVENRLVDRQVVFSLQIDNRLPDSFQGDQARIKQVLGRVITYAATFTRRGKVSLTIKQDSVDFKRGVVNVLFVVKDNSRGIASETLSRIGRDKTTSIISSDNGYKHDPALTLQLSRHYTQYLKGTFDVESITGVGNTFEIRFPIEVVRALDVKSAIEVFDAIRTDSTEAPNLTEQQDRLHDVQILIVDDNPLNNESLKLLLELEGGIVTDILSPINALQMLKQGSTPFKAIILDVQMPEMNGFDLAEAIRSLPAWHDTPIIFISANYDRSQHDRCQAAGGNLLLSKPFNRERLITSLKALITGEDVPMESPSIADAEVPESHSESTLDVDMALENLGGNIKIFNNMLSRFLDRIEADADEFRQLMLADDPGAVSTKAHFIAGGAAIIGASAFSKWLKDFEQRVVSEQKLVQIDSDLTTFDSLCGETINAVKTFIEAS